jgi:hypothetical protein
MAAQENPNHLVFRKSTNQWLVNFRIAPVIFINHCDIYAKSMFITVYSCSEQ